MFWWWMTGIKNLEDEYNHSKGEGADAEVF